MAFDKAQKSCYDDQMSSSHPSAKEIAKTTETLHRLADLQPINILSEADLPELKPYACSARFAALNHPEFRVLRKGITVIGGEASSGKTTLALQMALDVLLHNEDTALLFFSLDESKERAKRKILSLLLALQERLPLAKRATRYDLSYQPLTPEILAILKEEEQANLLSRIIISDDPYFLEKEHDAFINSVIHMKKRKVMVIVDYLQLLPKANYNGNLRENFNAILAFLKQQVNYVNSQMHHEVWLLLLSQVSRSNQSGLYSFRETSEIENIADSAFLLDQSDNNTENVIKNKNKILSLHRNLKLIKNKDGARAIFQISMANDIPFFSHVQLLHQRVLSSNSVFRVGSS